MTILNIYSLLIKYTSLRTRDFTIYYDYIRGNNAIAIERNPKQIFAFRLFLGCFLMWVAHMLYLAAAPNLTESQRVIHYDLGYSLSGRTQTSYGSTAMMGSHAYMMYVFYSTPLERNNQLLLKIIENNAGQVDEDGTEENWMFLASLSLFYEGGSAMLCSAVRRYLLRTINAMLIYRFVIELCLLFIHIVMARAFIQCALSEYSSCQMPILFVAYLVNAIMSDVFSVLYGHTTVQMISTGIVQWHIIKLKMKLIYAYLSKRQQKPLFKKIFFYKYRTESIHLLEYITEYNRVFGPLFFGFLLAHCPLNAYFVVGMILGNFSAWGSLFINLCVVFQIFAIFIVHYRFAQLTAEYHKPSLVLLSIAAKKSQQLVGVRAKVRLSSYAGAMHTTNRYGITYGTAFGLVTVESFSQFLYLYVMCLLMVHNLVKIK